MWAGRVLSRDAARLPPAFAGPASGGGDESGVARLAARDALEEPLSESPHLRFLRVRGGLWDSLGLLRCESCCCCC